MTKSLNSTRPIFENFNPQAPAETQAAPAEPTFSQTELAQARQQAWNEGYLAAARRHAGENASHARLAFADLLDRSEEMDRRLDALAEHHAVIVARWLGRTFLAAFPALAGVALDGRIRQVARLLQPLLRAQARIELRDTAGGSVWCESAESLWRQIGQRRIEAPDADIIIAWPNGEALISPAGVWEEIQAAILPVTGEPAAAEAFQFTIKPMELTAHV